MRLKLVNTKEQFENIQEGDLILVKWSNDFVKHTPKANKTMFYLVYENKNTDAEIICQKKDNHYFNYNRYLEGLSSALEVYKVVDI